MTAGRNVGHMGKYLSNKRVLIRTKYRDGPHVRELVECGKRDMSALKFTLTSKGNPEERELDL